MCGRLHGCLYPLAGHPRALGAAFTPGRRVLVGPYATQTALPAGGAAGGGDSPLSRHHCACGAPVRVDFPPWPSRWRRPPRAALMSATPRRLNVSMSEARSATLRVHLSSLAISTTPTWRPCTASMTRCRAAGPRRRNPGGAVLQAYLRRHAARLMAAP